ncbi:MAG: hypothetical protein WBL31_14760, partial [Ilumatobacteraceae bacterium]
MFLSKCGYFENRTMAINTVVMSTNSYTTRRDSPGSLSIFSIYFSRYVFSPKSELFAIYKMNPDG